MGPRTLPLRILLAMGTRNDADRSWPFKPQLVVVQAIICLGTRGPVIMGKGSMRAGGGPVSKKVKAQM